MKRKYTKTCGLHLAPVIVATLTLLASGMAAAGQNPGAYRMAVFLDGAYGEQLVAGEFEQAIDRLAADGGRFAASNNLCVAYIMAKDADNAREACETAVRQSMRRLRHAGTWDRPALKRDQAVALTNRGVVFAMSGDLDGARDDFERALKLRSRLVEPEVNLDRLQAALAAAR